MQSVCLLLHSVYTQRHCMWVFITQWDRMILLRKTSKSIDGNDGKRAQNGKKNEKKTEKSSYLQAKYFFFCHRMRGLLPIHCWFFCNSKTHSFLNTLFGFVCTSFSLHFNWSNGFCVCFFVVVFFFVETSTFFLCFYCVQNWCCQFFFFAFYWWLQFYSFRTHFRLSGESADVAICCWCINYCLNYSFFHFK